MLNTRGGLKKTSKDAEDDHLTNRDEGKVEACNGCLVLVLKNADAPRAALVL